MSLKSKQKNPKKIILNKQVVVVRGGLRLPLDSRWRTLTTFKVQSRFVVKKLMTEKRSGRPFEPFMH